MRLSDAGIDFIAKFEGRRMAVYLDPVGLPTVGVGHLLTAAEKKKWPVGHKLSTAEVNELFRKDVKRFEDAVNSKVKVPLRQNEFDALVSLAFNIGTGALSKSTVLRRLNAGDRHGAADAFLSWNKAGGRVLNGLTRRRKAEREMFLSGLLSFPDQPPAETPKPLGPEIKTAFKYLYGLQLSQTTLALLNKLRACPEFKDLS